MIWMRLLKRALLGRRPVTGAERQRLEAWVRLKFQLEPAMPPPRSSRPVGRLMEAGMDADEAVETVLRILREERR